MPGLRRKTEELSGRICRSRQPTRARAARISFCEGTRAEDVPIPHSLTRGPTVISNAPSPIRQISRPREMTANVSGDTCTGAFPAALFTRMTSLSSRFTVIPSSIRAMRAKDSSRAASEYPL